MDADDTARAPMAKAILQSKELPWPMEIGSRGLVVLFPQPVNQKVEAVLARNGLSAKDHTTTPLRGGHQRRHAASCDGGQSEGKDP